MDIFAAFVRPADGKFYAGYGDLGSPVFLDGLKGARVFFIDSPDSLAEYESAAGKLNCAVARYSYKSCSDPVVSGITLDDRGLMISGGIQMALHRLSTHMLCV